MYVLTGAGDRKAYFFRAFSSSAELQRKRGTAALVSRDGTFTKIEERIFLFDGRIDCFVFGDYVYVLRRSEYRRVFDQLDEVRRRAREAAGALHAKVPIANFDEFAEACSTQAAMADKLLAVQRRDYFDRLSYDMLAPGYSGVQPADPGAGARRRFPPRLPYRARAPLAHPAPGRRRPPQVGDDGPSL